MTMQELDAAAKADAGARLLECCGSPKWVDHLLAGRPYHDLARLQATATDVWWTLDTSDWLAAFAHHPRIGETKKVSPWSAQEQSGMNSAAAEVAGKLAHLNQSYLEKFGYIFIVCATGKSAAEMLHLLEARLSNSPTEELRIAAAEQNKITLLRLEKLISE